MRRAGLPSHRWSRVTSNVRPHHTHPAMTPLFKKLNLGAAEVIDVLNAPATFEPELEQLSGVKVKRNVTEAVDFALAFVTNLREVERAVEQLTRSAAPDAILWMVYPKGSSKKYKCDFNRDTGWSSLGQAGYEPVRQVAIDEDWSALRFRKAEFIKTMRRKSVSAISEIGRRRAKQQREA